MDKRELSEWLRHAPRRQLVMGIINLTPDSFSDGGKIAGAPEALAAVRQMVEQGADWIDVGGESTRPGSMPVPEDEQIRRTAGAISAIRNQLSTVISIDTTRWNVAAAALDAGADVVNDISAGRDDPAMLPSVARRGAPIILMHMQGTPATMQINPTYADVTAEVSQFLQERVAAAKAAGIESWRILLDPGLGFGKDDRHNLQLLRDTAKLTEIGYPLVVGPSRKGFIGKILQQPDPAGRLFGTGAAVAWAVANGTAVVRVHDVGPIAQVVRVIRAIAEAKISDFRPE